MSDRRRDPQIPPRQEQEDAATASDYDRAIHLGTGHAAAEATGILQEIDHAAALLGEILGRSGPDRRRLVEEQPRFRALLLCDLLLGRSREAGFIDPAAAVELAQLAVVVSDRLDAEHYGEELVEDARARAWAHLANAFRISSDLRQAEEALRTAEEHHGQGSEDAYTGAEILGFKASLRNSQGRYLEAAALLESRPR